MSSYFGGAQRPMCPNPIHCGGVHNPSHRAQFRHQCPHGKSCPQQYVTGHKEEFAHDLFGVEQRTVQGPVVTAPQVVPGAPPPYQALPFIPGMEGSGPDRLAHDPVRGQSNFGTGDTYVMSNPSDAQPLQPGVQPVVMGQPTTEEPSNAKTAAPLPQQQQPYQMQPPQMQQQQFAPGFAPPPPVMMQNQTPSVPVVTAMPPPASMVMPMAPARIAPMPPAPGNAGYAQPPPQPSSPFPGYYLHQQGK